MLGNLTTGLFLLRSLSSLSDPFVGLFCHFVSFFSLILPELFPFCRVAGSWMLSYLIVTLLSCQLYHRLSISFSHGLPLPENISFELILLSVGNLFLADKVLSALEVEYVSLTGNIVHRRVGFHFRYVKIRDKDKKMVKYDHMLKIWWC